MWVVVATIGIGTMVIKAAGPVLLGARPLAAGVASVVGLLAPALLAALVATATLGQGQAVALDTRLVGLGAAVVAILVRAPTLAVVLVAAVAAAVARMLVGAG